MKKILAILVTIPLLVACFTGCSGSDEYPSGDITVIVPYGAGGNTDATIRALTTAMTEIDDSFTMLVENKDGGAGLVGQTALKQAEPDGYTLGAVSCELFLQQELGLSNGLSLDDYQIISIPGGDPYGLVISAKNPNFSTIEEFVAYAQEHPGEVKIGHCGVGGTTHVALLALENYFDIEFDIYAYGGSADCINAISSGEIDGTFTQPNPAVAGLKSGTLLMPVILATERMEAWPDSPTLMEVFGEEYDLAMRGVVMLGAPKGLPEDVFEKLSNLVSRNQDVRPADAEIRRCEQRVGRDVDADMLHGADAAHASHGRAESDFGRHLFIGGPFAVKDILVLRQVFKNLGAGRSGVGRGDAHAGFICAARDGLVARHQLFHCIHLSLVCGPSAIPLLPAQGGTALRSFYLVCVVCFIDSAPPRSPARWTTAWCRRCRRARRGRWAPWRRQ